MLGVWLQLDMQVMPDSVAPAGLTLLVSGDSPV